MPSRATERINFGKIKEIIAPPNLIELQTNSYKEFLQADLSQSKRKNLGLQAVFTEVFPIESYDGKCVLDFHSYEIGEPKVDWLECDEACLPGKADVKATLIIGAESKPSANASLLEKYSGRVPLVGASLEARAWWAGPVKARTRTRSSTSGARCAKAG